MSDEKPKRQLSEAEIEQRRAAGRANAGGTKTMTDAALEQRRAAAQLSTGPKTEEGKAASSRNNWKHGLYSQITRAPDWMRLVLASGAKPCRSTCDKFESCSLVADGLTQPGQNCLDKQVFVEAFDSILATLHSGDVQYSHGLLASQVAGALEVLHKLREEIAENGVMYLLPMTDKDGNHVGDKPISNPALPHYLKLLDVLGINLPELMATPRAVLQRKAEEDAGDAVADLFGRLALAATGRRPGRVVDADYVEGDE